jgi:hypothetical protein
MIMITIILVALVAAASNNTYVSDKGTQGGNQAVQVGKYPNNKFSLKCQKMAKKN